MKRDRVEIRRGKDDLLYWHFRARNGRITADGAEGYSTKGGAVRAARKHAERMSAALRGVEAIEFVKDGE